MKKYYLLFAVILGCFSIAIFALQRTLSSYSTPSEVVKNYYDLAVEGKFEEALSFWRDCKPVQTCAKAVIVSGKDPIERWTTRINKYKNSFEIIEEKVEDDRASVLAHEKLPDGYIDETIYKLIKVNGKWRLNGLSSPVMEEADKGTIKDE